MKLLKRKRTRPLMVGILGAGPAGLFAAQAVADTGNIIRLFSRGDKSPLYGAQYLHSPVPGLDCGQSKAVSYLLKGTSLEYRQKVYGSNDLNFRVSPEVLASHHEAWDIRAAYDDAWTKFGGLLEPGLITPSVLAGGYGWLDLVIWTLPLAPFCQGEHNFLAQSVWAQGDAPALGLECSVTVDPWSVVLNSADSPRWYRASNVFGHRTAEWPDGVKPPIEGVVKVHKPIGTNCDCWPEVSGAPVLRVGRYGTWTKGELSHLAYDKTRARLEAM